MEGGLLTDRDDEVAATVWIMSDMESGGCGGIKALRFLREGDV